jgi:hypothetical protein
MFEPVTTQNFRLGILYMYIYIYIFQYILSTSAGYVCHLSILEDSTYLFPHQLAHYRSVCVVWVFDTCVMIVHQCCTYIYVYTIPIRDCRMVHYLSYYFYYNIMANYYFCCDEQEKTLMEWVTLFDPDFWHLAESSRQTPAWGYTAIYQ